MKGRRLRSAAPFVWPLVAARRQNVPGGFSVDPPPAPVAHSAPS
jgi:hypothetical protein